MGKILTEPGTPAWWGRAAAQIETSISDRPGRPTALTRFADTASLPDPAAFPASIAFHVALGVPIVSDGAHWYPVTVGAAL